MKYTILIGLVLMMLVVAGCGTKETPPEVVDTPPELPDDTSMEGNDDTPPKPLLNEISNTPSEFKVTYELTSTGMDGKQMMTQYVKGANSRTDLKIENMKTQSFVIDGVNTMCNDATGDWMCMRYQPENPNPKSITDDAKDRITRNSDAKPVSSGTKVVAGQSADCYSFEAENLEGESCFNKDGILVYSKGIMTTEGQTMTTEFTATSVSTTVADSDFSLPAAVLTQ
ncbi:MAG: hypothetical protein GY861_10710 [bacterium]|nr:hypothetical protein [bacterium]